MGCTFLLWQYFSFPPKVWPQWGLHGTPYYHQWLSTVSSHSTNISHPVWTIHTVQLSACCSFYLHCGASPSSCAAQCSVTAQRSPCSPGAPYLPSSCHLTTWYFAPITFSWFRCPGWWSLCPKSFCWEKVCPQCSWKHSVCEAQWNEVGLWRLITIPLSSGFHHSFQEVHCHFDIFF